MSFDPATALIDLGTSVIERLFPDPAQQANERLKLAELAQNGDLAQLNAHVKLMLGQLEINKAEAQHKSLFVAGWRPAVGWVCVSVLAFNYIGVYLLEYINAFLETPVNVPTRFDMSELWPLLLGMLGVGGMRSFDKSKGTATDRIK